MSFLIYAFYSSLEQAITNFIIKYINYQPNFKIKKQSKIRFIRAKRRKNKQAL